MAKDKSGAIDKADNERHLEGGVRNMPELPKDSLSSKDEGLDEVAAQRRKKAGKATRDPTGG